MGVTAVNLNEGDSSLSYSDFVHTDPGTLAGRFMRMYWQPIYRSQDLATGKAVPVKIMGEDFTLYRGNSGTAHLLAPHCAHRRTQLSVGRVEGDCIRCFYHGWKYEASGQCVEQPAEEASFAGKVRIRSYPTEEYLGLVFAYLGEETPPVLQRFPEFEGDGVLEVETFLRPCNYFNDLDNACDPLHVTFVHGDSRIDINRFIDAANLGAEENEFGLSIKVPRTTHGAGIRVNQYGMPNIQLLKLPPVDKAETEWRDFISWRVPVDDLQYVSFNLNMVHLDAEDAQRYKAARADVFAKASATAAELAPDVLAGKTVIEDVKHRIPDVVRLQDDVVLVAQGVIPDRSQDHLGRSDVGVILLRKIWRRELEAMAKQQPIKRWVRAPGIVATSGLT
jgi:5,5'-dehydrodivanillate O-demethylase oxygenase subunit